MLRHSLKSIILTGAIACALTVQGAAAQTPTTLGVGLSLLAADGMAAGFAVNAHRDLTSGPAAAGIVGDVSVNADNGATWTAFGGGVRISGRPADAAIVPFGQFLVGASVISAGGTDTFLTLTFGGGVNVPLSERLNLLVQFDVLRALSEFGGETGKRTTFGLSIPLGAD